MTGVKGEDTILEVPVGTLVTDAEDGTMICDLTKPGEEFILCEWGRWGFGNAHFKGSTRQAPNFAELGDIGDERMVKFELKLVADVGLVGLPNAGKSTTIQSITNVKPKIAPYPFTTIIPNLGVMEYKGRSIVIEDAPGLIEGASEGKGLGIEFLKHIERTSVIVHLIDASVGEEEIIKNYHIIRHELEQWGRKNGMRDEWWGRVEGEWKENSEEEGIHPYAETPVTLENSAEKINSRGTLADKPELIVFSKADIIDAEMLDEMVKAFEKQTKKKVALTISAGAYIRTDELKDLFLEIIPEIPLPREIEEDEEWMLLEAEKEDRKVKIYDLKREKDPKRCRIKRIDDKTFEVTGERIEEIVRMTDIRYVDGINRVYDVMERLGVIRKIKLMITSEIAEWGHTGFFVGEDDIESPDVLIAGKKFSLENILFMKGANE